MAKQIVNEPHEIPAVMTANRFGGRRNDPDSQTMVPRRLSVEELSFAAHVDYIQNSGFIEEVGAKVVILVHGEQNNMGRLKSALLSKNHEKKEADRIKIYNPKNCEELRIPYRGEKFAKVCHAAKVRVLPSCVAPCLPNHNHSSTTPQTLPPCASTH
jgi:cleavage and polyadenylation specificity factor subunit 3